MTEVPVWTRGGFVMALVDDSDAALVSQRHWSLTRNGYAVAKTHGKRIWMHRLVLGEAPFEGAVGDHINRKRLDNRRSNLRWVGKAESLQNRGAWGKSRYRGVSWSSTHQGWRAAVVAGGKRHYLGTFASEEEAGRAASEFRREHMPYAVEDIA